MRNPTITKSMNSMIAIESHIKTMVMYFLDSSYILCVFKSLACMILINMMIIILEVAKGRQTFMEQASAERENKTAGKFR